VIVRKWLMVSQKHMAAILCVITPIHIDSNPIEFTVLKIKPIKIIKNNEH